MPPVRPPSRPGADLCLIVIFLLVLALPLLGSVAGGRLARAVDENRRLAALPRLSLHRSSIVSFPERFEEYFNDHFGFRDLLVHTIGQLRLHWLRLSASEHVVLGKHGWLYYAVLPVGEDYPVTRPLSERELQDWQRLLENRRNWLARRGIAYYFVIAPEKQSIYPDYLPRPVQRSYSGRSRLDQFVQYLHSHSTVAVIDLRDSLAAARGRDRLFFLSDTHWNGAGAFAAYGKIMAVLAIDYPQLRPLPPSAFPLTRATLAVGGMDLARMAGLDRTAQEEDLVADPWQPPRAVCRPEAVAMREAGRLRHLEATVYECPDPGLPRAVIFHDSFGTALRTFLGNHFRRSVWAPTYTVDSSVVESERPDLVIQVMLERELEERPIEDPPEIQPESPDRRGWLARQ